MSQNPAKERENTEETITIEGENIPSGQVNVKHQPPEDDLNPPTISELIKDGSTGFFEYVIEFEEEHPWIFFGGVALILFLIIGGITSLFFNFSAEKFSFNSYFKNKIDWFSKSDEPDKKQATLMLKGVVKGFESGLILSRKDSYDAIVYHTQDDVFLANEFSFIQQLRNALNTDIQNELLKIEGEEARLNLLRDYLVYLINLEKKGAENYIKLETLMNNFENEKDYYNKQRKNSLIETNEALDTGGTNQLSSAMKQMYEYENKYDEVDNKLILTKQIYTAYKEPLKLAQARIASIRANKDILILGVKVFSLHDTGIALIEEGKVQDWYTSKAPITDRIRYTGKYLPEISSTDNNSIIIPDYVTKEAIDGIMDKGR